jgi:heme exporter protein B
MTTRALLCESTGLLLLVKMEDPRNHSDERGRPRRPPHPLGERAERAGQTFARATASVLLKDLRIELSTGEILTTTAFFAILVVILEAMSLSTGDEVTTRVAPGALWLAIVFSSVLALGRSWQREREESAFTGLLVAPIPRAAIWCGKALGVLAFVLAVEVVLVALVALLFHVDLPAVGGVLAAIMVLGTVGVAATGTLFGAMTVRTRARELILAAVMLPLLSPAILTSVVATRDVFWAAVHGEPVDLGEVGASLLLLAVYDLVAIVGAVTMFGPLLED